MNNIDKLTLKELKEWLRYVNQFRELEHMKPYHNGYYLTSWDVSNFIPLNHKIMCICHEIHNNNMMGYLKGGLK